MNRTRPLIKKILYAFPKRIRDASPREINVVEISEAKSKRLNRIYRKKNEPANVLSFRYGSKYGEILISPDVVRKESHAAGNSYRFQRAWMIVHGMLHLAGVHHEKSRREARRAEKIEKGVLKKLLGA